LKPKIINRTIFAPATLVGESSITVVRLSGQNVYSIMGEVFSKDQKIFSTVDFSKIKSHSILHGYLFDEKCIIDEVVISIFKAPNSFTGEDLCEISLHGGRIVYGKVTSVLLKKNASFAEPGEYSKRAFLNGKMDLIQAEAIASLIRAKTQLSYQAAEEQLKGSISKNINLLREELVDYCSLLELEIDFTEEGFELTDKSLLINRIDNILYNIEKLANSYKSGRLIHDGINLAITGKPNAGKSTLFNFLLKDCRAIVSDIPGTTRDYLEEPLILEGFVYNLIDTAGIREAYNIIEKEGVKKSFKKIQDADLVINVIDIGDKSNNIDPDSNGKIIQVFNKADLISSLPSGEICVSALTGLNMNLLEKEIVKRTKTLTQDALKSEIIITNQRHRDLLLKSCEFLVNAKNLIICKAGNELISIEIKEAIQQLDEIIGRITNVDILNNIFSKFCIGK
jgi:tRNA modification GTPase